VEVVDILVEVVALLYQQLIFIQILIIGEEAVVEVMTLMELVIMQQSIQAEVMLQDYLDIIKGMDM